MAIVRWDPARELDTLQSEFDRLFDPFAGVRPEVRARRLGARHGPPRD